MRKKVEAKIMDTISIEWNWERKLELWFKLTLFVSPLCPWKRH